MPTIKLTEKAMATLPAPAAGQVTYYDRDLAGFAVVVGTMSRTFVLKKWVEGKKRKITIGRAGAIRNDGLAWTVTLARRRAVELLGEVAAGRAPAMPSSPAPAGASGPTLRHGLELHVENMAKRRRSERSIHTIRAEITKYLADWLDRPMAELTGSELDAVCKRLMGSTAARAGAVNPPGAALTNRLIAQVSAIWNALDKLHDLPGKNPARRVTTHALAPKQDRIPDSELPGWLAKVEQLSPVRRDLQLFALFSGLRSESVRMLRWDDVDTARRFLHIARAKGDKPYTIPLADTHIEILARRRAGNAIEFGHLEGDHGWVFPSVSRARPIRVIHVAEAKERRRDESTGERVKFVPGLHPLRKTFNSIAMEIGIVKEDRERLMNHEGQGVNVRHYGFPQNWGHLSECQAKIEAALWARLRAEQGTHHA
jgi:integrase